MRAYECMLTCSSTGDTIVAIDRISTADLGHDEAMNMLRKPGATNIQVTVKTEAPAPGPAPYHTCARYCNWLSNCVHTVTDVCATLYTQYRACTRVQPHR